MGQFKQGEYIVLTKGLGGISLKDYCFKQGKEGYNLNPELDSFGNNKNICSWDLYKDRDQNHWRYATISESAYYEKVGKPFNVLEMPQLANNTNFWW